MAQGNTPDMISKTDRKAAAWVIHDRDATDKKDPPSAEWINESQDNKIAYETASQVWEELALLDRDAIRHPNPAANDMTQSTGSGAMRLSFRFLAVAAVVLVAVIGGFRAPDMITRTFADHSTSRGEVRSVMLDDGSQVMLDAASAIDVNFTERAREVRLISGRASFDVTPAGDGVPPFVVRTANSTTRALGTKFDVQVSGDDTDKMITVTAIEHQIELTPDINHIDQAVVLSPGQQVSFAAKAPEVAIREISLAASTSWQKGLLIFDHVRLSDVTRTLNRYASGPILISNGSLAEREVSGMFRIDRIDDAVDVISNGLGASSYSIPYVATFLVE